MSHPALAPPDVASLVHSIAPILSDQLERRFRDATPNPLAIPALASTGLLGLSLPRSYGGLGADYQVLAAASEALARIDLAYQIDLTVHLALTAMTILQWGTPDQRERWLPDLASGTSFATFGLTEPGAGSDVAGIQMRAIPDGNGYRLSGEKTWISAASDATLFLLFATLDPAARHRGITAFVVPRDTPGLVTIPLHGKLGVRAGNTGSVVCQEVVVQAKDILGDPGEGFAVALSALSLGLFTVGAGALGVAAECFALTIAFLNDLDRRGLPAGREQWVQAHIAAMVSGEARARVLISHAAALKNRGEPSQRMTSLAKWVAADVAAEAASTALEIHQAFAPGSHPTIERHLRNIKGSVVYGGTAEIHQTMQAAYALGDRIERPVRRPPPTAADLAT